MKLKIGVFLGLSASIILTTLCAAKPAAAISFTEENVGFSNSGDGANFTLKFTNLPAPAGGGTLDLVAFGDFADNGRNGNSFNNPDENYTVVLDPSGDNLSLGTFLNDNPADDRGNNPTDVGTQYGDGGDQSGTATSSVVTLTSSELSSLLADGELNIFVDTSDEVGFQPNGAPEEFFRATLDYTAATPVPFDFSPSLGLLALGGVWGASHLRRKLAMGSNKLLK